jgi:nucleotide-binding universal stress UspA family protein
MKILLPVDGSGASNRALDYLVKHLGGYREVEIQLLNVQQPVSGSVSAFVNRDTIATFHQEEGMKVLRRATRKLDAAGVKYEYHIGLGEPAETIAAYAKKQRCDQILMGTRGMGSVSNLVLGSVAMKVIHLTSVPVLLVK